MHGIYEIKFWIQFLHLPSLSQLPLTPFLIMPPPPATISICRSCLSCQQNPALWLAAKISVTHLFKSLGEDTNLHDSKNRHYGYSFKYYMLALFFVACQLILQSGSLSGTCVTTYSGNQTLAIPHLKESYCHRKWRLFTCDTETPTLTSYQT